MIKIAKDAGIARDEFIEQMKVFNLGAGIHFLAVNQLDYYQKLNPAPTPNAEQIGNTCLSLPFFPSMSDEDVDYVASVVAHIIS